MALIFHSVKYTGKRYGFIVHVHVTGANSILANFNYEQSIVAFKNPIPTLAIMRKLFL